MKIYLVGMPGSGKSTIGKQLSQKLQTDFVDLDQEIEAKAGRTVDKIFSEMGEDHFRVIESQLLQEWAGREKSFIMATGGGTPCFYNGMDTINQTGISIFIDEPVEVLVTRLKSKKDRPLLVAADIAALKEKLQSMHTARLKFYQMAHITVRSANLSKVMEAIRLRT
ncbi:MAG TPA: shikimate kinase [Chryseolinea sp.]|nr:shikimate kinase [Chryseolinea sp.]